VDKVSWWREAGRSRYRLLETVRQYARDRLLECGDGPRGAIGISPFLSLGEKAEPRLGGPEQQVWLGRIETEYDNLRAALAWSSAGDAPRGLQLAGAIWRYWYMRGLFGEGRGWLAALLANAPGGPSSARAKALNAAGTLAWQRPTIRRRPLRTTMRWRSGANSATATASQARCPTWATLPTVSATIRRPGHGSTRAWSSAANGAIARALPTR
jgi:hypothetical protein